MKSCLVEIDADRLIIRNRPRPRLAAAWLGLGAPLGLALLLVALFAMKGSDPAALLIVGLPGFALLANALVLGLWFLADRRLTIDRSAGQVIAAWKLPLLGNTTRQPLGTPQAVSWFLREVTRPEGSSSTTSTSYPVNLLAEGRIRTHALRTASSIDEARLITRVVGEFLGVPQSHWDDEVLDPASETARQMAARQQVEIANLRRLGFASRLEWQLTPDGRRLVLRRRTRSLAPPFLRLCGAFLSVMGGLFVLIPALGGTFNGRPDAFWAPVLLGLLMLLAGLALALGRRRTTIDRDRRQVLRWWGPVVPLLTRRHDLDRYASVRHDRRLRNNRVEGLALLAAREGPDLVLHRSIDLTETQALAAALAAFLEWPLHPGRTAREIPAPRGPGPLAG